MNFVTLLKNLRNRDIPFELHYRGSADMIYCSACVVEVTESLLCYQGLDGEAFELYFKPVSDIVAVRFGRRNVAVDRLRTPKTWKLPNIEEKSVKGILSFAKGHQMLITVVISEEGDSEFGRVIDLTESTLILNLIDDQGRDDGELMVLLKMIEGIVLEDLYSKNRALLLNEELSAK